MRIGAQYKKNRHLSLFMGLLVFALLLAVFAGGLRSVTSRVDEEELALLVSTLDGAAVSCYAIEGFYPPNLEYLVSNYAVVIDEERYHVYYDVFASNVRPIIEVMRRGAEEI